MAGAGYKLFNTGDVLTAAQVNTYLMEQTVMVFADAAARTTALSGVVSEGMISYLKDTNAVEVYDGSNWVSSDDPNAIQNTIVDAKGDLIAASAADTPARLAVGNNGESLVADSSQTAGLRYNPGVGTLANPIINGGMDVFQRGTASTAIGSGTFLADRWQAARGGFAAGGSQSRQTVSDTTNLPNIQYSLRIQRDSGNTSTATLVVGQNIESINSIPFAGKTVTLSFYARCGANFSQASSQIGSDFASGTGTDQNLVMSGTLTGISNTQTNHTLTTTWQRFVVTKSIATNATQLAVQFYYTPVGTAGANDWFEITGVQIDVGTWTASTAPTFRRSGGALAGELSLCQRYYWRTGNTAQAYGLLTPNVLIFSATSAAASFYNPTIMRVPATSVEFSGLQILDWQLNTFTPSATTLSVTTSTYLSAVDMTIAGATAYRSGLLRQNNSTAAYIGFSAEL